MIGIREASSTTPLTITIGLLYGMKEEKQNHNNIHMWRNDISVWLQPNVRENKRIEHIELVDQFKSRYSKFKGAIANITMGRLICMSWYKYIINDFD